MRTPAPYRVMSEYPMASMSRERVEAKSDFDSERAITLPPVSMLRLASRRTLG